MRSQRSRVICTATSLVSPDCADRYAASGSAICEVGSQHVGELVHGQRGELGDREPGECHRERLRPQAGAAARRAGDGVDELQGALAHRRALRVRQRVHHVALGTRERARVRVVRVDWVVARVDVHARLLVGVEDPVAIGLRELLPRAVDIVAERDEDVAQVLALPRSRPRRDGALADRQRRIRHEQVLRHPVGLAQAMALRARSDRRVGREPVGVHDLGRALGIAAGAREEHPQQVRERRDRADRRARRPAAPALLQRHRRRQPVDLVDVRHPGLLQQPPRVRGHGLEVPPLRLRVDRAERQRRLPRPRHAGEHDHRVARDGHVHVAQVVLARSADADAAVMGGVHRFGLPAFAEVASAVT